MRGSGKHENGTCKGADSWEGARAPLWLSGIFFITANRCRMRLMQRQELAFPILQVALDALAVTLAGVAAYWLRFTPMITSVLPLDISLPFLKFTTLLVVATVVQLVIFGVLGLYRIETPPSFGREFGSVFLGATLLLAAVAIWTTLTRQFFESRFIILVGWLFIIVMVNISHGLVRALRSYFAHVFGFGVRQVFLVGHNNPGRNSEVMHFLGDPQHEGFHVIGERQEIDISGIQQIFSRNRPDELWLTDLNYPTRQLRQLIHLAQRWDVKVRVASGVLEEFRTEPKVVGGFLPTLEIANTPLAGWGWIAKRSLDIIGAAVLLVGGLPFALIMAVIIKWDSPGPVLVRLKRAGQDGEPFFVYKFRSMVHGAHKYKPALRKYSEREEPLFKMRDDPRITRVGRFLRKHRLDEFPQILNVLKGEMSLVGPRPHELEELEQFEEWQKRTLSIPPGITGLGQISGSAQLAPKREAELDIYYLENWSLGLDIAILLRTLFRLFKDPGAY